MKSSAYRYLGKKGSNESLESEVAIVIQVASDSGNNWLAKEEEELKKQREIDEEEKMKRRDSLDKKIYKFRIKDDNDEEDKESEGERSAEEGRSEGETDIAEKEEEGDQESRQPEEDLKSEQDRTSDITEKAPRLEQEPEDNVSLESGSQRIEENDEQE
ncbi:hypothetical protein PoB_003299100 [Plakobranchus ocellatus]|uniref:Uncharacterized protein n=1 Tax=Plakobranchus ocellatus TaxID=259542 RepID=A0AAV4ADQ1_9GAST|nr:hypothetical protein PoB_003299100 [Plakobranchus ocellatus]